MNLGHWLNSLSAVDHGILLIIFIIGLFFSHTTIKASIEFYDKKKKHQKSRIRFRVTPASLVIFGFIYSLIIYNIFKSMFDFIP